MFWFQENQSISKCGDIFEIFNTTIGLVLK